MCVLLLTTENGVLACSHKELAVFLRSPFDKTAPVIYTCLYP